MMNVYVGTANAAKFLENLWSLVVIIVQINCVMC